MTACLRSARSSTNPFPVPSGLHGPRADASPARPTSASRDGIPRLSPLKSNPIQSTLRRRCPSPCIPEGRLRPAPSAASQSRSSRGSSDTSSGSSASLGTNLRAITTGRPQLRRASQLPEPIPASDEAGTALVSDAARRFHPQSRSLQELPLRGGRATKPHLPYLAAGRGRMAPIAPDSS